MYISPKSLVVSDWLIDYQKYRYFTADFINIGERQNHLVAVKILNKDQIMNNKLYGLLGILFISGNVFAAVAPAQVPKTGESGGATGSNMGVAWPNPRFVAGTGATADCITDKLTGLMWPKNGIIGFEATDGGGPIAQPNYANTTATLNQITWAQALTGVANMNTAPNKLCGYSDWRLPNKVELKSLINYGQSNPASWLNGQGFANVQDYLYWSSSSIAISTLNAWYVYFADGSTDALDKTASIHVWPVRGGQ